MNFITLSVLLIRQSKRWKVSCGKYFHGYDRLHSGFEGIVLAVQLLAYQRVEISLEGQRRDGVHGAEQWSLERSL